MAKERQDLIPILEGNLSWDRKGEIPDGKLPYYNAPVFNWKDGKLLTIYDRKFFDTCSRHDGVAKLSEKEVQALDYFDECAESQALRLDMDFNPGDIQLIHNHQILHSRSSYDDFDDIFQRRHLLRLWLSVSDEAGWELPASYSERYAGIEKGKIRGGISEANKCVVLDPE